MYIGIVHITPILIWNLLQFPNVGLEPYLVCERQEICIMTLMLIFPGMTPQVIVCPWIDPISVNWKKILAGGMV